MSVEDVAKLMDETAEAQAAVDVSVVIVDYVYIFIGLPLIMFHMVHLQEMSSVISGGSISLEDDDDLLKELAGLGTINLYYIYNHKYILVWFG